MFNLMSVLMCYVVYAAHVPILVTEYDLVSGTLMQWLVQLLVVIFIGSWYTYTAVLFVYFMCHYLVI
jgi:hypothetical protein